MLFESPKPDHWIGDQKIQDCWFWLKKIFLIYYYLKTPNKYPNKLKMLIS
jgi:hypothetical protein